MRYVLLCLLFLTVPAKADTAPALKNHVTVFKDEIALNDLLTNPVANGSVALFASPEPGDSGTIQSARIVEAAKSYGVRITLPEWSEISVTREARVIGKEEITKAILQKAAEEFHADEAATEISFFGSPSEVKLEKDADAPLQVSGFRFDRISGRFEAQLVVPGSKRLTESTPLRLAGSAFEMVDVLQLTHRIDRGTAVSDADVHLVRIKRQQLVPNALRKIDDVKGMIAKRDLEPETYLRTNDVQKAQLIKRNEMVLLIYETPAMSVTTRGKALSDGTMDDVIEIQNLSSKRSVSATVIGEGKVKVETSMAPRNVAALTPVRNEK